MGRLFPNPDRAIADECDCTCVCPQPDPISVVPSFEPATLPILRVGATGNAVKILQRLLALEGFFDGESTGIFGDRTEEAVVAFQEENDLSPDGVAGPQTWAVLLEE